MPPESEFPSNGFPFPDCAEKAWQHMLEILRQARMERDWSQDQLAGKMKVAPSFISQAESGVTIPSVVFVLEWCGVLDLDMGKIHSVGYRALGDGRTSPD